MKFKSKRPIELVMSLANKAISLSSPILVQRHINALLLSKFLRLQDRQGKLDKLTLEWWMLPRDGNSRQERFVSWCECFDPVKQADISDGLGALVKRTVFEGRSTPTALVGEVGRLTEAHAQQWLQELNAIDAQIDELSRRSEEDQIPLRALQIQRKRLTGEYRVSLIIEMRSEYSRTDRSFADSGRGIHQPTPDRLACYRMPHCN